MAQRQFRSDDTSLWQEYYCSGSYGDATLSGTYGSGIGGWHESCSGTSGNSSLVVNSGWSGSFPCIIHQTRGTGVGNWEINYITSMSSGTATLKYPLINTYTDSGTSQAQCVLMREYDNITISGTLTGTNWNQDRGGIIALMAKTSINISGTITCSTKGHIYGNQVQGNPATAYCGEGTNSTSTQTTNPTGNAGGGGYQQNDASAGGGGGNGTAGGTGAKRNYTGGVGGDVSGNAGLTSMVMGGGAGGGTRDNNTSGRGGYGGGIIILISPSITISGSVTASGEAGQTITTGCGGGGGAGGSVLLKCKTATLGTTKIVSTGGSGGVGLTLDAIPINGGAGGTGRIHLDYSTSYTGTTNPTIDVRQDASLLGITPTTNYLRSMRGRSRYT